MSRVTNSILLRFGITLFWSSSLFKNKTKHSFLTLNSLLILVLKNYFLQIIKTQYLMDNIILYVLKFNNEKFSLLDKYLSLQKNKFDNVMYRKIYSVKYLFSKKQKKPISILKKLQYITCLQLLTSFTINLHLSKNKNNFCSVFLPLIFPLFKNVKKTVFSGVRLFKIKRLNFVIKLKWLGLLISDLIFNYFSKKIYVNIKTITECLQFVKLPFFFNKIKLNSDKKQKFFRLLLSFIFFTTKIISYDISKLILNVKNKKHINALKSYFGLIQVLFLNSIVSLKGIKIQIAGRLNGKLRKSRFGFVLGSVKLMTLNTECTFSLESIYTQYGVFSLKI